MIEHLLDEALVSALPGGDGRDSLIWQDLEQAGMSARSGWPTRSPTPPRERLIATHEAGHADVAWLSPAPAPGGPLHRQAGRVAGLLAHGDREDVYTRTRTEMERLIEIAMGGQVAEELFFGDVSTGPGGDLAYATLGRADRRLGRHGRLAGLARRPRGGPTAATWSAGCSATGGPEGGALLPEQKDGVRLLAENRHLVEALRDALLERHELIGHEITDVLDAAAAAGPSPLGTVPALQPAGPEVVDLRRVVAVRPR